jgi:hypothetical protein
MPEPSLRRSRFAGLVTAAIAIVLLLELSVAVGLARAADPVGIEVRPLLAGRFDSGGWLAVEMRLSNDGAPIDGYVAITGEDGVVRRPVELPAGARKNVVLYIRPPAFSRQIEARFEDREGRAVASGSAPVRVLPQGGGQLVIVGDGAGNLRAQLVGRRAGLPEPVTVLAADLPERPEPLRGIETIVWASDSTALTEGQRRGLERWLASGGHLVLVGGADWQARSASFLDLLPVGPLAADDDARASELGELVSGEVNSVQQAFGPLTAATGELLDGAIAIAALDDGRPLLAAVTRGAGRVTYLAVDIGAAPISGWEGASFLWSRLLGGTSWATQFGGRPMDEETTGIIAQALGQLPALDVPPAELLLAVIVAYILLIGPVSYVVLRRLDRRELAWVTAPVLVLVFSAGTYGIGSAIKGSDVILHEISIVRTAAGGSAASVQTYAGIFSPTRDSYDLVVRGAARGGGGHPHRGGGAGARAGAPAGRRPRRHPAAVARR